MAGAPHGRWSEHLADLHGEGVLLFIFMAYSVNYYEQQQQQLSQMDHLKCLVNLKIMKDVASAKDLWGTV